MADWTDITNAQVDPDAPLTSELAYAWRDNVVAVTEGAAGAPKVRPNALGGVFHLGALSNTGTNSSNFINTGGVSSFYGFLDKATTATPQFSLSSNNGASWGSYISLGSSDGGSYYFFSINTSTGSVIDMRRDASLPTTSAGSFTPVPGCNAIRFRLSTGVGAYSVMLMKGGGQ